MKTCCCSFALLLSLILSPLYAAEAPQSYFCIEAQSGQVLAESNADIQRPPASMIKLMQLLLVAEGVEAGKWSLEKPITASLHAQKMGGTQIYLEAGQTWPLETMMQAVAVASANDAAMAVAENLWGSEAHYRLAMNARALELDMDSTRFYSVHGLPPDSGEPFDVTTARDMGRLACACAQQPLVMRWVSQKEFRLRPEDAPKSSTNKLLWRMKDCDGMKTGYIRAAGFCITATAEREGLRLISIVMGSQSKYGRFNLAQELMEKVFDKVAAQKAPALETE